MDSIPEQADLRGPQELFVLQNFLSEPDESPRIF